MQRAQAVAVRGLSKWAAARVLPSPATQSLWNCGIKASVSVGCSRAALHGWPAVGAADACFRARATSHWAKWPRRQLSTEAVATVEPQAPVEEAVPVEQVPLPHPALRLRFFCVCTALRRPDSPADCRMLFHAAAHKAARGPRRTTTAQGEGLGCAAARQGVRPASG